jgi:hypothetical protein
MSIDFLWSVKIGWEVLIHPSLVEAHLTPRTFFHRKHFAGFVWVEFFLTHLSFLSLHVQQKRRPTQHGTSYHHCQCCKLQLFVLEGMPQFLMHANQRKRRLPLPRMPLERLYIGKGIFLSTCNTSIIKTSNNIFVVSIWLKIWVQVYNMTPKSKRWWRLTSLTTSQWWFVILRLPGLELVLSQNTVMNYVHRT